MKRRRGGSAGVRLRRGVQVAALLGFFALVLAARPVPGEAPGGWLGVAFYLDPLIPLVTLLAAHSVLPAFGLALATVVLTLLLGRVFCGWICPLGTLHAAAGRFCDRWRPRGAERWSRWQLAKYFVLALLVVMAALGASWLIIFDPLVLLYRTTTTALLPAVQWAAEEGALAVYKGDPGVGEWRVARWTEPAYAFVRDHVFVTPNQAFIGGGLLLGLFLVLLGLNYFRRRFWCRYLCPLGALLGILSWRPWITRRVDAGVCNSCDVCGMTCHGAAASKPGTGWKPQECLGCLNCTDSCARDGLQFTFAPIWRRRRDEEAIDVSRRGLLAAVLVGGAGAALLKITPQGRGATFHAQLIRPPGARAEDDFLDRCTACGLCMKICPTGGLQPAWFEAGLAGLWTPRLVPRIGYCDYECNRCGDVCPTGAIAPLDLAAKKEMRIGLAAFDPSRCLPYAFGRDCMVCEEHCPVPEKAIYFLPVDVTTRAGETVTVQRPYVDPERCIGCGICESVCPFQDMPAIRVTSANESRHEGNQPILPGGGYY